ncbi:hypothetical protein HT594_00058 [Phenacoccus solenopsis nudivirus]|nr:hypothetical protein HT594_00058 [Phenacoccus solenopsis nudivirus]
MRILYYKYCTEILLLLIFYINVFFVPCIRVLCIYYRNDKYEKTVTFLYINKTVAYDDDIIILLFLYVILIYSYHVYNEQKK